MKTKKKESKTVFTFWLENLKAKEYTIGIEEIKNKYREFLKGKDLSWMEYYHHQTVVAFITAKDGLNSNFELNDLDELQTKLMPVRHEFYKK